jgi:hypothetical protein
MPMGCNEFDLLELAVHVNRSYWLLSGAALWAAASSGYASTSTVASAPVSASAPASPQTPVLIPTRMQFCNVEVTLPDGSERKRVMRECLVRRAEGERLLERECRSQLSSVPFSSASDKHQAHKQCLLPRLQISYQDMPRRPIPVAPPVSSPVDSNATPVIDSSPVFNGNQ